MKLTAKARRSGSWWAIEVPQIPGLFTQVRRLDQAMEMVVDAATLLGLTGPFDVEVVPELSGDLEDQIHAVQALAAEAGVLQRRAAASSRELVERLRGEGLTVRDVAAVLSISPQRVSQLSHRDPDAAVA